MVGPDKKHSVVINIRRAGPHDFVNIMWLLEQAVQEETVGYPPINELKLMQWITDCKRDGEILVADCSRSLVGVLGMMVKEWNWSTDKFIGNEFFYVLPKFRKRGTADALLKAAEKFSDDHNIRLVVGFSGGKDAVIKDRMASIRGYTYGGGTFHRLPRPITPT